MKKIFSILTCALTVLSIASCDWFMLDNQDGYNASVYGKFVDKTGAPVYQEQGGAFNIYEKVSGGQAYIGRDWDQETSQSWTMKSNGTYVNRLVFAGDYYMKSLNANFVADAQDFQLKKGENEVNFTVNPYVRITDVNISVQGDKYVATCKVTTDLPESTVNNVGQVRFCCFSDRFVSNAQNNISNKDAASIVTNVDPKGGQTITLTINTKDPNNSYEFTYKKPHYVRIAALGAHYSIVPEWSETVQPQVNWGANYENYNIIAADPAVDMAAVWQGDNSSIPAKYWVNGKTEPYTIVHPAEYMNDGVSNTQNKYNYSAVYKIDVNGTVTEVTDWGDIK